MSELATQPTTTTIIQPGADNTESHMQSLDERTDALFERLTAETRDEQASEEPAEAPAAEPAPETATVPEKPKDSLSDLEARAKAERDRVAEKRAQAQRERELTQARQEAKAREDAFAKREAEIAAREKRFEDPTEFLTWIEEKGWGDKYAQHIIDLTANPAKRAELAAKRAAEAAASKQDERIAAIEAREKEIRETENRQRAERNLASRIEEVTAEAPLVARMMKKTPERAIALSHAIAANLSAQGLQFNLDDIIINMQRELSEYASSLAEPTAPGPSETETAATAKPTPSPAAAPANTVSNRAAASRTGIVTEDAPLTYRERIAAAERRARQQR